MRLNFVIVNYKTSYKILKIHFLKFTNMRLLLTAKKLMGPILTSQVIQFFFPQIHHSLRDAWFVLLCNCVGLNIARGGQILGK